MFSSTIVFPGQLRSRQDQPYAKTVVPILTNMGLQLRLQCLASMLAGHPEYGSRVTTLVRRTEFTSLFAEDWEIQLEVQFYIGTRGPGQLPDTDNILTPLFNGLTIPQKSINLPSAFAGKHFRTLAVDDGQFTTHKVELIPFPDTGTPYDLTAIRFTAFPPPHLQAARAR